MLLNKYDNLLHFLQHNMWSICCLFHHSYLYTFVVVCPIWLSELTRFATTIQIQIQLLVNECKFSGSDLASLCSYTGISRSNAVSCRPRHGLYCGKSETSSHRHNPAHAQPEHKHMRRNSNGLFVCQSQPPCK